VREGEESLSERLTRPSYLSSGRLSATKDPGYEERSASSRYTSARPVARRSVSRELFDLKYNTGKISPTPYYSSLSETEPLSSALSPVSRRVSRVGTRDTREGSSSREETTDFGLGSGYSRSTSLSRGPDPLSPSRNLPSRPSLASSGRSTTQNEIMNEHLLFSKDGNKLRVIPYVKQQRPSKNLTAKLMDNKPRPASSLTSSSSSSSSGSSSTSDATSSEDSEYEIQEIYQLKEWFPPDLTKQPAKTGTSSLTLIQSRSSTGKGIREMRIEADPGEFK